MNPEEIRKWAEGLNKAAEAICESIQERLRNVKDSREWLKMSMPLTAMRRFQADLSVYIQQLEDESRKAP